MLANKEPELGFSMGKGDHLMKARTAILSVLFVGLFVVSSDAQQYYRPHYTQKHLSESQTAPVFLENRTGGYLKVKVEVKGVSIPVEVLVDSEVPDLMLPLGAVAKVKEAKALVLSNGKMKYRKVKYYIYWRKDSQDRPAQQGWLFYLSDLFRP